MAELVSITSGEVDVNDVAVEGKRKRGKGAVDDAGEKPKRKPAAAKKQKKNPKVRLLLNLVDVEEIAV